MQKILIIQAPYYQKISKMLLEGASTALKKENIDFDIINVPGALEIPTAISMAKNNNKYQGFIALGCVIRGETSHYDYVCQESAHGLNMLAINHQLAIGNGIITTENEEQAIARSDPNQKNKGGFAAQTCITMIKLKTDLSSS
jgi:6,7-dimethyl-8-ribityllumazine synthase